MLQEHTITFFPSQNPVMVSVSCINDGKLLLAIMSTTVDNGYGSISSRSDYDQILKDLFVEINRQISEQSSVQN
jgi:hypothetical protein